jgi:signal transduction histidine kinase
MRSRPLEDASRDFSRRACALSAALAGYAVFLAATAVNGFELAIDLGLIALNSACACALAAAMLGPLPLTVLERAHCIQLCACAALVALTHSHARFAREGATLHHDGELMLPFIAVAAAISPLQQRLLCPFMMFAVACDVVFVAVRPAGEDDPVVVLVRKHVRLASVSLAIALSRIPAHSLERGCSAGKSADVQPNAQSAAERDGEIATRARSRVIRVVMHDISTPLLSFANIIEELSSLPADTRLGDDEVELSLDALSSCTELVQHIVSDFCDFERIESGNLVLVHAPFRAEQLQRMTHATFSTIAQAKGVRLVLDDLDAEARGALLVGDLRRIEHCLNNGMSNAIKHTPSGGVVRITVSLIPHEGGREWTTLRIAVRDTGVGLSADELGVLCQEEAFVKVGRGQMLGEGGSGLGIALSRRIMRLHNGSTLKLLSRGPTLGFTYEMLVVCKLSADSGSTSRHSQRTVRLERLVRQGDGSAQRFSRTVSPIADAREIGESEKSGVSSKGKVRRQRALQAAASRAIVPVSEHSVEIRAEHWNPSKSPQGASRFANSRALDDDGPASPAKAEAPWARHEINNRAGCARKSRFGPMSVSVDVLPVPRLDATAGAGDGALEARGSNVASDSEVPRAPSIADASSRIASSSLGSGASAAGGADGHGTRPRRSLNGAGSEPPRQALTFPVGFRVLHVEVSCACAVVRAALRRRSCAGASRVRVGRCGEGLQLGGSARCLRGAPSALIPPGPSSIARRRAPTARAGRCDPAQDASSAHLPQARRRV